MGVIERIESFRKINNLFPRRRSFESNSIIYSKKKIENIKPKISDITKNHFFNLNISSSEQYKIENTLEFFPKRQNIHRTYLRLSLIKQKNKYLEKAIGLSIQDFEKLQSRILKLKCFF